MKEFIWHEIQPRRQSMKRNIYLAALAALLCACGIGLHDPGPNRFFSETRIPA